MSYESDARNDLNPRPVACMRRRTSDIVYDAEVMYRGMNYKLPDQYKDHHSAMAAAKTFCDKLIRDMHHAALKHITRLPEAKA